jgi:hypothetical protein
MPASHVQEPRALHVVQDIRIENQRTGAHEGRQLKSLKTFKPVEALEIVKIVVETANLLVWCPVSTLCKSIVIPSLPRDLRVANTAEISRLRYAMLGMTGAKVFNGH